MQLFTGGANGWSGVAAMCIHDVGGGGHCSCECRLEQQVQLFWT